ncbi:DMT family transporter [Paenibacillus gorillae]|uniref:DMT family transporter n=1 Tax=Paenibacillus gorillae TaxID=1243662 RepID=UPI0004AEA84B|nr:EamA family transporter [Paenibacillus gorillae]
MKNIALGLLFTLLWSSAAIAIKLGLHATTPLLLANIRFLIAGALLFIYVYCVKRSYRMPRREEWRPLIILGTLNTTIYLGATSLALDKVSAGLFNLFVTVNPFLVALLSSVWLKRQITGKEWIGMLVAAIGLFIATWPALADSHFQLTGIMLVAAGMTAMALGSVYFKKANLELPGLVINTWQLVIGGVLSLPVTYFFERDKYVLHFDYYLAGSLFWLVFIISIATMLLWFYLLKQDAVRANNWLFMTPIFGFMLSAAILNEAVTTYDWIATAFVVTGLLVSGNIAVKRVGIQKVQ